METKNLQALLRPACPSVDAKPEQVQRSAPPLTFLKPSAQECQPLLRQRGKAAALPTATKRGTVFGGLSGSGSRTQQVRVVGLLGVHIKKRIYGGSVNLPS